MEISEQLGSATTQDEVEPFLEVTPELVSSGAARAASFGIALFATVPPSLALSLYLYLCSFALSGPYLWTINPDAANILNVNATLASPTVAHPFGTDDVGRDTMARAMYGGRVSLLVGFASMLMAIVFGVGIGSFAGFFGGVVDNILMRFTDIILAVPLYLLLFVLSVSFTDGTPKSIIILIAIFG